jgi:hypothetical protein
MTFEVFIEIENYIKGERLRGSYVGEPITYEEHSDLYSPKNNPFVPFYALNPSLSLKFDNTHILYRDVNSFEYSPAITITYSRVLSVLKNTVNRCINYKSSRGYSRKYFITKGYIGYFGEMHTPSARIKIPLLCLSVKSNRVKDVSKGRYDIQDFVLLISREFSTDPVHKNMYNKVNREYIKPLVELGVSVLVCENIDGYIFNEVELNKPGKLTDLVEYLDSFNDIVFDYSNKEEKEDGKEKTRSSALSESEAQEIFEELISENSITANSEPEPGDYF